MMSQTKASNRGVIEFLIVDLDIALTLLDVAKTSEFRGTAARNHRNARKAYDTVLAKLPEVTPDAAQQAILDAKLAELRARLEAIGRL